MHRSRIRTNSRIASLLCIIIVLSLNAGCSTAFQTFHDPMHPIGDYTDLKAIATGFIDRIELRIQRFAIDPISGEEISETPVLVVKICDPLFSVTKLTCIYRAPWSGHNKMIEFHGKAVLWNGAERNETYKFASGDYPLASDDLDPEDRRPIPIRAKGSPVSMLDIVIVPDPDLQDQSETKPWSTLRWLLDDLVDNVYFEYEAVREWRGLYNFYYSRDQGQFSVDGAGNCVFTSLPGMEAGADVLLYVHAAVVRDCTFENKLSTEIWYDKSAVHESGHALIGLRDEYAGANYFYYPPHACMSNIFPTKADCESEAPDIGLPPSYCVLADSFWGIWRIDPTGALGSIMGPSQHLAWSNFGPASMRRIYWRYDKCLDGNCMSSNDLCD